MKRHSPTLKTQVVLEMLNEEKSVGQIAAEYGIHPGHPPPAQVLAQEHEKKVAELYEEIGKLTTQLAWLKKKSGFDPDAR